MKTHQGPVLVIDDVPDTLNLVELTLKFKGYRVITATNGQEALQLIKKERPSLIITDILMPRMDGFSLVHKLRLQPGTRDIPVIFLSATYVTPEDKAFANAIGVTRLIEKPINMDKLLRNVEESLAQQEQDTRQPLNEHDFYEGYLKRLESKLQQKNSQIARIEVMLETLSDREKPSFESSLQSAIRERDEIRYRIDQIRLQLGL